MDCIEQSEACMNSALMLCIFVSVGEFDIGSKSNWKGRVTLAHCNLKKSVRGQRKQKTRSPTHQLEMFAATYATCRWGDATSKAWAHMVTCRMLREVLA